MPKQSTRGIWNPYPNYKPPRSGVRRVTFGAPGQKARDAYRYYSKSDDRWYTANGVAVTKYVHGFYELSR